MTESPPVAAALDLGSTFIKGAVLHADGRLSDGASQAAPPLHGTDGRREGDPEAYLETTRAVLERVTARHPGIPVGLASQRSSFVLFDSDGRPATPMISWQDRSALDWCLRHRSAAEEFHARTGLPLSPYYAGPKLAALQERDPGIAAALQRGELFFGTLDTFLLRRLARGRPHVTETGMAARTGMVDLVSCDWAEDLLQLFHVPRCALPEIVASGGRHHVLEGGMRVTATLTDQAAAAMDLVPLGGDAALVCLGTGVFAMRLIADGSRRLPGYLTAPLGRGPNGPGCFVLEGGINGAGVALAGFAAAEVRLPARDPAPGVFSLPDVSGLGAPYARADVSFRMSRAAADIRPEARRRVIIEGICFRIRQILEGLFDGELPERIRLSGGITREPALAPALAAVLGRPVERLTHTEAGLVGVARLASAARPEPDMAEECPPPPRAAWMEAKYHDWCRWLESELATT